MRINRKINFKFQISNFKCFRGQSLVEVIVALGIVVVLAISLVTASLVTQKTSRVARNNTQATKLVQENIEQVRVLRDRNGYTSLSDGLCYVLSTTDSNPNNWSFSSCTVNDLATQELKTLNFTEFRRRIAIQTDATDPKKLITVTVTWQEAGVTKVVSDYTYLTSLR